jgi:hypothetical protein
LSQGRGDRFLPAARALCDLVARMARPSVPLALALLLALGCRYPQGVNTPPGLAPRCAGGVCVEVIHFGTFEEAVGLWIDAPPATRLLNARFTIDDEPPCTGHIPIEWVKVDERVHRHGPVALDSGHGVILGFPINMWFAHSGMWRATFVDLELAVAGQPRCVRTRLTDARGKAAVGL